MTWLKRLSESQWIMLMTVAIISGLLFVATSAQAAYLGPDINATTLSHCGWVNAANRNYTNNPRNIKIIQRKLVSLGYSVGPRHIDGRYGRDTRHATRHFQNDYNIRRDGIVGPETATTLAYASHPINNVRRCKRNYMGNTH